MQKPNLTYKIKRKAVAHYDVQSIAANLHSPVVVSQKNTITGASAASKNTCVDQGDGKSNSLVMSCPCFRNEIGTEKEVSIVLNRLTASQSQIQTDDSLIIHCPSMASGLSILEDCSDRWRYNICPYQKMMLINTPITSPTTTTTMNNGAEKSKCFIIENCDIGASYYRMHFYGLEHQNWFGIDDNLGPIAISIRKERTNSPKPSINNFINNNITNSNGNGLYSGINTTTINNINGSSITNGQTNGSINLSVTTSSIASSNLSSSSSSNSSTTISSSTSTTSTTATASTTTTTNSSSLSTSSSSSSTSSSSSSSVQNNNRIKHQYRIIIRTSQLSVLRGTVYEDYIPALASSRHTNHNNHHAKEVLEYIAPELNLTTLRLGVSNADEQLLKLDEQVITRTYKVGVLYCKAGQGSEEEMYNNENSSPQFDEFLSCLGEQVRLKGFDKYRAGLDNKTDTTGLYSIYANYHDCEIMFHVSTLLPYTPNNKQQLLRKRHIGNDIVTIVFQEPGALPFTPRNIRSHFQHVFIIVRVLPPEPEIGSVGASGGDNNNTSGLTRYAIAVTRSKEVSVFGPPIPDKGIFVRGKEFTDFILAKIINGENAAHKSEKFSSMAQRTRHGYLKDLATNYVTNTTLNDISCGNSASAKLVSTIFGSSKRRGSHRVKDWQFIGDQVIRGAIVWEATVNDFGQSKLVDCYVGISCDTFIIIEELTKQTLFACPNVSIIGWDASHSNYIEIFYHQGECIRLNCKDQGLDLDEISEIKTRLFSVTHGCQTKELILKRNNQGQLGFHIEPDGIVTDVEKFAFAWNAGLRPNCRIVKICEVVTATLNYNDMIDYLKTSSTVKITILDPNPDGSPKRGCNLAKCPYLSYMAAGSSINNNNLNNNNLVSRDSHLQLQPQLPTNSLNHGGDYENIRIMNDTKKYHLPSEFKNGLYHHRYHYTTGVPASALAAAAAAAHQQANKNNIGTLPLVNYPSTSPYGTSQSSKSLTVSPEKETDKMNKLTPSLSSSNIYSNMGSSSQLHHLSSSSFVSGLTRFTNSKREPLRPKSTTNECTSLSSSTTNLHNPNLGSPQLHLSSSSFVSGLTRFANTKREPLRPKSTTNECTSLSSSSSGSSLSTFNTPFLTSNMNNNTINSGKHSTLPGTTSITMSPSPILSSYAIAMPMLCSLNSSSSSEEDIDTEWPTLVETATKAMAINSTGSNSDALSVKSDNALEQWVREFEANVNSTPNGHLSSSSTPTSSISATTSTSSTNVNHPTTTITITNSNNPTTHSNTTSTTTTTNNTLSLPSTTTSSSLSSTSSLPTRRGTSGENLKELKETVQKLQYDLVKEQSDKAKLAELVKSLEKENSRLQEERKNAILQLKTLTDFFFNR